MIFALLAAPVFSLPPAAGLIGPEETPTGRAAVSFAAQEMDTRGLVASLRATTDVGYFAGSVLLMGSSANPTSFFTAEADGSVVVQTGTFLPINLMPSVGLGASFLTQDTPAGGRDQNLGLYLPVGLRYARALGQFKVGLDAIYHVQVYAPIPGAADVNRWHFEASARTGGILGGLFYDLGATYNGPGARIGVTF